ncbi:MAG: hypothetical protein K2N84_00885, partial [Clostridia bacterium]|nr:hypothetical protein [Clostridia bacterium]
HKAVELLQKYENKVWQQVIPQGEFPALLSFHSNIEYVRQVIADTVTLTAQKEDYVEVSKLDSDAPFFEYQQQVNAKDTDVPSHNVMRKYIADNGKDYRFDVKYTFGFLSSSRAYSVQVVPNPDVDFEFMAGNDIYTWQDVDLSSVFALKKEATTFTLSVPEELSLLKLLETLYPQKEITFDAAELTEAKFYSVVVSSDNGKVTYQIDFDVEGGSYVKVTDIFIDEDILAF